MTNEQQEAFMKAWGLDQPIPIQYCRWMGVCNPDGEGLRQLPSARRAGRTSCRARSAAPTNGILHGDLGLLDHVGRAGRRHGSSGRRCRRSSWPTAALIIWIGIAIVIGVYSAIKRYSLFDNVATVFCLHRLRDPDVLARDHAGLHLRGPGLNILPASGMVDIRRLAGVRQRRLLGVLRAAPRRRAPRRRQAPDPAGHHARRRQHRRRLAVRPGEHARRAQPGLRADGQGQGPAGPDASPSSTRCGTRCCRSSRTSASRSRSCSRARSSPRRSSPGRASAS